MWEHLSLGLKVRFQMFLLSLTSTHHISSKRLQNRFPHVDSGTSSGKIKVLMERKKLGLKLKKREGRHRTLVKAFLQNEETLTFGWSCFLRFRGLWCTSKLDSEAAKVPVRYHDAQTLD